MEPKPLVIPFPGSLGAYILNADGEPELCEDREQWAKFMETADRSVALDILPGDVRVSTVFLGLDHNFGYGVPILWETMIFNGPHDQYQERATSREEALENHAKAVTLARNAVN